MHRALIQANVLCAPTVGTFVPSVSPDDPLQEGTRIGRLRRVCRWKDVVAPPGCAGFADEVVPPYTAVEYGTPLVRLRSGALRSPSGGPPPSGANPVPPGQTVRSQVEGTLYHRPAPEASPFAPEGAQVRVHDIIALVEVMKTFTPIRSPISGIVKRWLVKDGGAIPIGAPLAVIKPLTSPSRVEGARVERARVEGARVDRASQESTS